MNVRTRRRVAALLLLLALLLPQAVQADSASITCYGEDLTSEQYTLVLDLLEADPATDTLIPVTHEDEVSLLGDIVPAEKIGSRSLSSARVTLAQEGAGIAVTVYNIDWVTPQMYASALSTAGVQDATIVVAAPVSVSGTAALAGILKAYESAAGTELSAAAKAAAGSEMVLTGDLADIIGSDQAVELIAMVKQAIADYNLTEFDTLRPYVVEGARQLGVDLTDEQIDQITNLGVRIAQLDLDPEQLAGQLQGLVNNFQRLQNLSEQASGLWSRIVLADGPLPLKQRAESQNPQRPKGKSLRPLRVSCAFAGLRARTSRAGPGRRGRRPRRTRPRRSSSPTWR